MSSQDAISSQIRSEITEDLIQSGKYRELSSMLQAKLQETTWKQQVDALVHKAVAMESLSAPNFTRAVSRIEAEAIGM